MRVVTINGYCTVRVVSCSVYRRRLRAAQRTNARMASADQPVTTCSATTRPLLAPQTQRPIDPTMLFAKHPTTSVFFLTERVAVSFFRREVFTPDFE